MKLPRRIHRPATVLVAAVLMAGCGRASTSLVGPGATGGTPAAAAPMTPVIAETPAETEAPAQAETDPVAGPVNLPSIPKAPTTTVEPSQLIVRSVAETLTLNPTPGFGAVAATVIRARVTWTPVKGVQSYRVYQTGMRGDGVKEQAKLLYSLPQWVPVAIAGGGYGVLNLNVGQEYVYTVEGVDRAGNVICRGQDHCMPLAPLNMPTLVSPAQNEARVGQSPTFKWTEVRGADGYYVQAFGLTRNTIPTLPLWRGFRKDQASINMIYGQQVDVFDGTRPMQWSLPLSTGTRYAWTVCAIRTDTHAMHSAKAIARATAPMGYFVP